MGSAPLDSAPLDDTAGPDHRIGDAGQSAAKPVRKPWRAPQFMLSQVPDTQFSASPIITDGTPVSQAS